jgi:hypothetical protein
VILSLSLFLSLGGGAGKIRIERWFFVFLTFFTRLLVPVEWRGPWMDGWMDGWLFVIWYSTRGLGWVGFARDEWMDGWIGNALADGCDGCGGLLLSFFSRSSSFPDTIRMRCFRVGGR